MKKNNIFYALKPYKWLILTLVLLTFISNGLNLLVPKIVSSGIDSYKNGQLIEQKLLIKFSLTIVFIFIFSYVQSLVQTFISETAGRDMRKQLMDKISKQSFSFVQTTGSAKLLTNLTSDVDAVKQFIAQASAMLVSSIFLIIGASSMILVTNWELGLAVLAVLPLIAATFFLVMSRIRPLFLKAQGVIDRLNRVINESILGATLIRVLNSTKEEDKKFLEVNGEATEIGLNILKYFSILIPTITFISGLATVIILGLGGHFIIINKMTLGDLAAFNSYVGILIFPIMMIGFVSNIIARSSASYDRIKKVLDAKIDKADGTLKKEIKGNIEFKNVSLNYGDRGVLKNVSFIIKPGTKTAIIGPTGAGKSQLLYLLNGLIWPQSGQIKYDGVDLKDYDQESLHAQVGYVFQDSIMFNMSLEENISFSDNVSEDELNKAIEAAELKEFTSNLPKGLDTIVSERGTSLSGGQKQRIMLARALALNPKVLLLDDFTARVDAKTEQRILNNVLREYQNITLISITQKIASVQDYDQIIFLMDGEIIAKGTHQELLKLCPEYVQLYESQRSTNHYELSTK
jgi:ATP-binding cassette subfamily B protein